MWFLGHRLMALIKSPLHKAKEQEHPPSWVFLDLFWKSKQQKILNVEAEANVSCRIGLLVFYRLIIISLLWTNNLHSIIIGAGKPHCKLRKEYSGIHKEILGDNKYGLRTIKEDSSELRFLNLIWSPYSKSHGNHCTIRNIQWPVLIPMCLLS